MDFTLENEYLRVVARAAGAELTSLYYKPQAKEYLWQADPKVWGRHAPILFPVVGRLKDDAFVYEGERYALGKHGFARDEPFRPTHQSPARLAFTLRDSTQTRQQYPFSFALTVTYTLRGNRLEVAYAVHNPAETDLYFSVGGHPGFAIQIFEGERIEDYYVAFDQFETLSTTRLDDGLRTDPPVPLLNHAREIPLTPETFAADALVLSNTASDTVFLRNRAGTYQVAMHYPGFPYLGIWAKPGAPYVCLEPWHGVADHVAHDGELRRKEGIVRLGAGQTFDCHYLITVGS